MEAENSFPLSLILVEQSTFCAFYISVTGLKFPIWTEDKIRPANWVAFLESPETFWVDFGHNYSQWIL